MVEASAVYEALGLPPTSEFQPNSAPSTPGKVRQRGATQHSGINSAGQKLSCLTPQALYELRNYQMHPGYGSVPKLIDAFTKGCAVLSISASRVGMGAFSSN